MTLRIRIATALAASALAVMATLPASAASAIFGVNLVADGNFEQAPVNMDASKTVVAPGWTFNGGMTVLSYGASGGYLAPGSPGPSDRGRNYVSGGVDSTSSGQQSISLASGAAKIDGGSAGYTLSAWLGGWGGQSDYATLSVAFLDSSGRTLATATIGGKPSSAFPVAELLSHSTHGIVPKGARSVRLVMTAVREEGSWNDGSIDDASLVLH